MRINTNVSSLTSTHSIRRISDEVNSSARNLSSGLRINSASDDAAGLSLSQKMKSSIRSADQARRNAGDGISILQTLEGHYSEVSSIFNRLKELSIQAASDTLKDEDRFLLDHEFGQMTTEARRIISNLSINNQKISVGSSDKIEKQLLNTIPRTLEIHVGVNSDLNTSKITFTPSDLNIGEEDFRVMRMNLKSKFSAREVISVIDKDIETLSISRSRLGAVQNRLNSTAENLSTKSLNESAAHSQIVDADYAEEASKNVKSKIQLNAATSVHAQTSGLGKHMLKLLE